jgi:hypothetical protein
MKRCFFDLTTGAFLKSVESSHQETIDRNTPPGASFADGDYDHSYYMSDGEVVQMGERPSELYAFDFASKTWVANPVSIKSRRLSLLEQSDWTDTLSAQNRLGPALYSAWQAYRQALRDMPEQAGFPEELVWPIPPA